ncbi:HdeD family acid-resistance protein [Deinococcus metallilatus]|uniref:HdeD family acid-resistance protein n=1 Tax=Deinococcus metallilatus TaxID=1211322 RepID=A0AAJ5F772_9DEIO|nr:HdeD family acid-resistance protein [Deinococcus metallilatus]MBB5294083.1 uncharacterized membrane protein HdeD (DUF308 family) [Deinococcus metallilatus]QBY08868.1 HdeD family acid-resistance protein [Deinococcus metallilatus]RXJ10012.1 HdeD family acid-resistance protein [Deinococcus metallilatus]TLK28051.1 HdeD family acid-resistance protein [Deinococcus metallilatus]GMA16581.1 membrane protein [Deinococcus metallilatus]
MTQPGNPGPAPTPSFRAAARSSWGWTVARGVLTLLFGILALIWPGAAFLSLAVVFGAYAFVDGIATLIGGFSSRAGGVRWPLVLSGVLGILAGIVTFVNPGATVLALLWLVAAWALVRGVLEIVAAIRWRAAIPGAGEWLVGLSGLLLVILGILLALNPIAGTLTVSYFIGVYALIAGIVLIVLGLRMRNL